MSHRGLPPGILRARKAAGCLALSIVLAVFVAGCAHSEIQSALHPRGEQAYRVAILWWAMLAVFTLVLLAVMALLAAAVTRRSRPEPPDEDRFRRNLVLGGGIVVPLVVIFALIVGSLFVGRYTASVPEDAPVTIHIVGHRWWWDVRYLLDDGRPGVRTANEIHLPVGVPVRLVLESRDVIHSFWMPNFQGKTDLIPGRTNTSWVTATEPGIYRGQCAEFCGLQHAKMAFAVVSQPADEFYAWIDRQARPAMTPTTPEEIRGREVLETATCVMCHAVRGTAALAEVAPDLTHVGSRLTLAAGTIPNTRGHLGGWLANPQRIKPGSLMPNLHLTSEELDALIAYLDSLK